jgi:hypothetical protein
MLTRSDTFAFVSFGGLALAASVSTLEAHATA